ncbi:MAG: hypothetical protein O7C58_05660, partial [Rickettsia endosymbiont of Ixodes persulcatus]|nr:hypothetical protein [Rickettsia endosymbiont of Ixodes persulcatus]
IHGGRVIAEGNAEEIKNFEESITGRYLSGRQTIKVPSETRVGHDNRAIELLGAVSNNLLISSICNPVVGSSSI